MLGGENLTLRQIFEKLGVISSLKAPGVRLPYAVAYAAGVVSTVWARVSGVEPRVPLDGVQNGSQENVGEARPCGSGTGLSVRARRIGLYGRAVEWFRANGYA